MDALYMDYPEAGEVFEQGTPYAVGIARITYELSVRLGIDRPYADRVVVVGNQKQGFVDIILTGLEGMLPLFSGVGRQCLGHNYLETLRDVLEHPPTYLRQKEDLPPLPPQQDQKLLVVHTDSLGSAKKELGDLLVNMGYHLTIVEKK